MPEGKLSVEVGGGVMVEEKTDQLGVPAPGAMELLREAEVADSPLGSQHLVHVLQHLQNVKPTLI